MAEQLNLSGERIIARYHLAGDEEEASARARDICLEQTVEYPEDLIRRKDIRDQIVGKVVSIERLQRDLHEAVIEFAVETAGDDLTQLLNLLFGNISLKPGIRLVRFELPQSLEKTFAGPRFGRKGLRKLAGVFGRPILCSAIKPMGLSVEELADLAYRFAKGGIDLIKDDHGISDQVFCRFDERVKRCADAVRRANAQTGESCLYVPNVSAPADKMLERVKTAKEAGAGGVLVAPGLTGFDAMRRIADDRDTALAVMSHPALLGAFTTPPDHGISPGSLYGNICRLAGADVSIFPSFQGRFAFLKDACREIVERTEAKMGEIAPIFPAPAGGMTLDNVPELLEFYGRDAVLVIGGDLHRHGADIVKNCRRFRKLVE